MSSCTGRANVTASNFAIPERGIGWISAEGESKRTSKKQLRWDTSRKAGCRIASGADVHRMRPVGGGFQVIVAVMQSVCSCYHPSTNVRPETSRFRRIWSLSTSMQHLPSAFAASSAQARDAEEYTKATSAVEFVATSSLNFQINLCFKCSVLLNRLPIDCHKS